MTEWDDGPRVRVLLSIDAEELPEAAAAVRRSLATLRMDVRSDRTEADVFVGVYGDRYGAIDPTLGLSRLERDYLFAGARPRLVYVLPGSGARDTHLALLLSRIQADDLTSYRRVSGPDELAALVVDDLAVLLTEAFTGEIPPVRELVGAATAAASTAAGHDPGGRLRPGPRARVPAPWHRLVGREKEVADVCRLLDSGSRLVTLTGPGGIGKSRLAIEVAGVAQEQRPDGAWFVDLAAIRDPALLAPTIAHALGIRESAGLAPVESLKSYLAGMDTLVLLDSFETVTAAAPLVVDLLASCPDLQVFVTSRSLLRVRGEYEYPLLPLAVPAAGVPGAADDAPALELFLERAAAANPSRVLDDLERESAAEICRRLEGVPLALELAAARTRLLPPTLLLRRLTRALDELTSGPLDLPERQRTLRTTIDWDHDLLGLEEQTLFRRLAVFPRQFTLDAAESVVGEPGLDVMDGLDGLSGKSLLRVGDVTPLGEPTFVMLQSVHDYALERLTDSGELDAVSGRHARWVLERVERSRAAEASEAEGWLAALEHDHADLRAALTWADSHLEVDLLLRLTAGLGEFWRSHCHFSEGRRWLDRSLSLSVGQRTTTRVDLLNAAAFIARARGDYDTAETFYREGLSIREELGDRTKLSGSLRFLGNVAYDRGNLDAADGWWRRSLALLEEVGDEARQMNVINNLGVVAHHRGDQLEAVRLYDRTYDLARTYGSAELRARAQMNKAIALCELGDVDAAVTSAREAVVTYSDLDDTWDLVDALDVLANALGRSGRTAEAGWLFAGAATLRTALDVLRPISEQADYDRGYQLSRAVDPETFDTAYAAGTSASLTEILARATGEATS